MAEPLTADEFYEAARDAQSHTVDGESTTARSADDILKLSQAGAHQESKRRLGIRFIKLVPPTARGDC